MKIHVTILMVFASVACFSQGKFFGGNGDGFASASLNNIALPLQIISFSAVKQTDKVQATLKITSDQAVCKMILEKSSDAISFHKADGLEDAAGLQGGTFLFNDTALLQATNYYRVKIIKCNGGILFTSVIMINTKEEKNLFWYSQSSGVIYYRVLKNGKIEIINAAGQLVYQSSVNKGSGAIFFTTPAKGIFFLCFPGELPLKFFIQ